MIKRCFSVGEPRWLIMRQALWRHCSREQHLAEMQMWCADRNRFAVFLAFTESEHPVGFAEASIRHDYVNGTDTSPVGFLEGLYVVPETRQKGVARELVAAVERWLALAGCQELASDTDVENEVSQEVHKALGFEETERVVFFRKRLDN
jgi:aminoglycoside 6'-N-acetyltransferase I